jgi:hypothetical protein
MVQALFARNDRFFLDEKRALDMIETFAARPQGFTRIVREVLAAPGSSAEALAASAARLRELVAATKELGAE